MCWSLNNPLWGQKGREGTYWTLKDKRVLLQKGSILHFESTNAMHLFTYLMDEEFLVLSHLLSTKDCGFRHLLACLSRDSMNSNTLTKVHHRRDRFFEKLVNGRKPSFTGGCESILISRGHHCKPHSAKNARARDEAALAIVVRPLFFKPWYESTRLRAKRVDYGAAKGRCCKALKATKTIVFPRCATSLYPEPVCLQSRCIFEQGHTEARPAFWPRVAKLSRSYKWQLCLSTRT